MVEAFDLTFDGSKEVIGYQKFQVDEALVVEVTELPRTGESWFKTIVTKNIEFKYFLQPTHKNLIWKKSIPTS